MRLVVEGLIDYGFFNKPKSLADIAKHLYIDGKQEDNILEGVLGEGKLKAANGSFSS